MSNLSIYYTWENIKKSYKNNKFKRSAAPWNEEFELPDGSYSISDIQDYFEYILKKHGEKTVNPSIKIYPNKIETRIIFNIGYHLEVLASEEIKLLRSTKSKITKDKNGENLLYLKNTKVVLKTCNLLIIVITKIQEFCIHLFLKNRSVNYGIFHTKMLYF